MKTKTIRALLAVSIVFFAITIASPLASTGSHGFGWIPLAYAETSGNSTGTATVGNAAPAITDPMLLTAANGQANNTDLDVWTEYHSNCSINDNNTLYNLMNVTWYIWEDTAVNWDSADVNATHYTFKYDNATDAYSEVGPGGSDMHLISGSCIKPTRTETTDEVMLAWKFNKDANHTGSRSWRINITVWDAAESANNQTLVFGVNYYFECTIVDSTHGWTGLGAGNTNVTLTSPGDFDIDLTCTSNAIFKLQAKSWNASLTSGGDTIAIGNVLIHEDTLGSALNLTVGYLDIGGLTSEAAADSVNKSFVLWISVPVGTPAGAYVYVLAVQGVEV